VDVAVTLAPLGFANVSVLWLDSDMDRVHLDLVQTTDRTMGMVSVKQATMKVFECGFEGDRVEVYPVNIDSESVEQAHIQVLQNDSHYSPFRTIVLVPAVKWLLGGADTGVQERVGHIKNGQWYEGNDPLQMFVGLLFAWCTGLAFLVIMRRPPVDQFVIVGGRQKRVFNETTTTKR
tara:strand:- start:10181 stop:10711 length:531 start_codon:yes stop_codon:yes gene_type:complete